MQVTNFTPFDPQNSEHCAIVAEAIHNADQFGVGRLSRVREALLFADIEPGFDGAVDAVVFAFGK